MRRYRALVHIGLRPTGVPEYPAGSYLPPDYPALERLIAIGAVEVEKVEEAEVSAPSSKPEEPHSGGTQDGETAATPSPSPEDSSPESAKRKRR